MIFTIKERTKDPRHFGQFIKFWAAMPNKVPYPNEDIAFENTKNKGVTNVNKTGYYEYSLEEPAPYYSNDQILIQPCVFYQFCDKKGDPLSDVFTKLFEQPLRPKPVVNCLMTQEEILRAKALPDCFC